MHLKSAWNRVKSQTLLTPNNIYAISMECHVKRFPFVVYLHKGYILTITISNSELRTTYVCSQFLSSYLCSLFITSYCYCSLIHYYRLEALSTAHPQLVHGKFPPIAILLSIIHNHSYKISGTQFIESEKWKGGKTIHKSQNKVQFTSVKWFDVFVTLLRQLNRTTLIIISNNV